MEPSVFFCNPATHRYMGRPGFCFSWNIELWIFWRAQNRKHHFWNRISAIKTYICLPVSVHSVLRSFYGYQPLIFIFSPPISKSDWSICHDFFLKKIIIVVLWFAGCWEEDSAGCVSEKRKRPSSADTDDGGGRESKKPLAAANGTRAP